MAIANFRLAAILRFQLEVVFKNIPTSTAISSVKQPKTSVANRASQAHDFPRAIRLSHQVPIQPYDRVKKELPGTSPSFCFTPPSFFFEK